MNGIAYHPAGQSQGLTRRSEHYDRNTPANQELKDEVMLALDRLESLDQGKRDISREPGYVHVQSKAGRVVESGSYRYRIENDGPGFRDREGYWEQPTRRVLDNVVYTRSTLGAKGQPLSSVTLSLAGGVGGDSLLSKTVQDRDGKTVTTGGAGRGSFEIHYFPGDNLNVAG